MTSGPSTAILAGAFFLASLLYSSVGHAGASGDLAAMALLNASTPMMRPTALVLNILVATIAAVRFASAGLCSWSLLWPFLLGSVPFAFLGGAITLPGHWYRTVIGLVLWAAALRLFFGLPSGQAPHRPRLPAAVGSGAVIGLLAGLTGTGGGTFLSPLLVFTGWAETRETAGVAAVFIVVNSIAGLAANPHSLAHLSGQLPLWVLAAAAGGLIGSELGARRIGVPMFRRMLALVLIVAGTKLVFA
jgi:uncharacterized membrane protein YfcA